MCQIPLKIANLVQKIFKNRKTLLVKKKMRSDVEKFKILRKKQTKNKMKNSKMGQIPLKNRKHGSKNLKKSKNVIGEEKMRSDVEKFKM